MSYISKLSNEEIFNFLKKHGLKPTILYSTSGSPLPPIERTKRDVFIRCKREPMFEIKEFSLISKMLGIDKSFFNFSTAGIILTSFDAVILNPFENDEAIAIFYHDWINLLSEKFGEKYKQSLQNYNNRLNVNQQELK